MDTRFPSSLMPVKLPGRGTCWCVKVVLIEESLNYETLHVLQSSVKRDLVEDT